MCSVLKVFVDTIDMIDTMQNETGQLLVCESKKGECLNYVPEMFRSVMVKLGVPEKDITSVLGLYRDIGLIITDNRGLTNAQFVNGKTRRVITARVKGYEGIKRLLEMNDDDPEKGDQCGHNSPED